MSLGIDYSWARPSGAAIKAAGYTFACRYLSSDTTGKTLSSTEAKDLLDNGISIPLVWEDAANAALGGESQGVSDATKALAEAEALGLPGDRPIYFAVDFDSTPAQQVQIDAYLKGVASVIGEARVGVYGSFYVCERCSQNGTAKWFWQTLAWSGGQQFSGNNIYQNGQSAFGSGADVDNGQTADIGAWEAGSTANPVTPSAPAPVQPVSQPAPAASSGPGGTYTVKSGDNLSGIGVKTGASWRAIAQLNGISAPYTIYPNEILRLPGSSAAPAPTTSATTRYTVVSGDNLIEIAAKFHTTVDEIAKLNNIADVNKINAGEVLVISTSVSSTPAPQGRTYTVVSGDTLSKIGSKEGVAWQTIASLNGISAPYTIYPNQTLKI